MYIGELLEWKKYIYSRYILPGLAMSHNIISPTWHTVAQQFSSYTLMAMNISRNRCAFHTSFSSPGLSIYYLYYGSQRLSQSRPVPATRLQTAFKLSNRKLQNMYALKFVCRMSESPRDQEQIARLAVHHRTASLQLTKPPSPYSICKLNHPHLPQDPPKPTHPKSLTDTVNTTDSPPGTYMDSHTPSPPSTHSPHTVPSAPRFP